MLKQVNNYFYELGLAEICNLEASLTRRFGEEKGKRIIKDIVRLNEERNSCGHDENCQKIEEELYTLNTSSYEMAMICEGFYDFNIVQESCLTILKNSEYLGNTILDVGCGVGIITCFAAINNPTKKFVGIDRVQSAIDIANQIKEKLKIDNAKTKGADFIICSFYLSIFWYTLCGKIN